jgi:hypothetical protein
MYGKHERKRLSKFQLSFSLMKDVQSKNSMLTPGKDTNAFFRGFDQRPSGGKITHVFGPHESSPSVCGCITACVACEALRTDLGRQISVKAMLQIKGRARFNLVAQSNEDIAYSLLEQTSNNGDDDSNAMFEWNQSREIISC